MCVGCGGGLDCHTLHQVTPKQGGQAYLLGIVSLVYDLV